MNIQIQESLKYIKRDALAGTVAGTMAVPLTVGICLMSDYPVITGLYTVIFAGIVSFITYLFKPGNYTGTPGVAAGLAPALALGVQSFGIENMPFVIFLTAIFQALVWKYRLEEYILRIVPHYLVEGLLAGVGLKIALKFIPFLYDITHETDTWLNLEREIILILSIVSFISFILLYKYYKLKMPALPYFVIIGTSFILSFVIPLKMVDFEAIPFKLSIPLPQLPLDNGSETFFILLKMLGFAIMLGTIDVIEQVMSNVAIEKMDPRSRKADSNNSLLAIWIANMGATFFGGMTNLDGLAKSTTNTVAGAVTKLSNLFTSLVLLLVVLFPVILEHLPEYALGIIMVYSGWKMIANIEHVRSEGRYALIMAGICGFMVFELGIFEGLLLVLFAHAVIQYIFMRRQGKSYGEIMKVFKQSFQAEGDKSELERKDMMLEPLVPVFHKWVKAINSRDLQALMKLYSKDALVVPALSKYTLRSKVEIRNFYQNLFLREDLTLFPLPKISHRINQLKIDMGEYKLCWKTEKETIRLDFNFTLIIQNGKITTQHTSLKSPIEIANIFNEL